MVVTVVKADNNEVDRAKTTMNSKKKKENLEMKPQKRAEPTKEFLQFWEAYPRKVGKLAAFKAFEKVDPDAELLKKMIETIEQWKKSKQWKKDNCQFIPHPQTWLNQGRWDDILSKDEIDQDDDEESYNDSYVPRGGW